MDSSLISVCKDFSISACKDSVFDINLIGKEVFVAKLIGDPSWLPGDRERQSANGKEKEKYVCPEPEDVESTYGHQWVNDPDWYQKILPRPSLYVNAFLEHVDQITDKPYWDISVLRVRIVGKNDARLSVIISGVDDFWFQDFGDRDFVILDNLKKGKKHIRYALSRQQFEVVAETLNVNVLKVRV